MFERAFFSKQISGKVFSSFVERGLLFVRCSVFLAVISGVCLLVWYGRAKAKSFIEAKLLPSVCSVLSEHIQRDLDFGKVLKISPLSITLESCSVGPHSGEFSCGEAPTVKLRVLPFSSLMRGKIVFDAVLSHPSLLIVQKRDFSWLGIPSSEGGLQRHISTEEVIDYRTKTRRIAREEAAARCARERDDAARQAAEMGYILSEQISGPSEDTLEEHHCMDTGVAYDLKHADLEKSFGVKVSGSGPRFWSRTISVNPRDKLKRKANRSNNSAAGVTAKRRILERSALMASAYFRGLSPGNFDEPSQSTAGYDSAKLDNVLLKIEGNADGCTSVVDGYREPIPSANQIGVLKIGGEKNVEHGELRTAINDAGSKGSLELGNNIKQDIGNRDDSTTQLITEHKNPSAPVNNISLTHDPFHMTIGRLSEVRILGENMEPLSEVKGVAKTDECNLNNEVLGGAHVVNKNMDMGDNSCGLQDHVVEPLHDLSASQEGHKSRGLILTRLGPWHAMHHSFPIWPLSPKSLLPSFPKNMGDLLSCFLAHSIQKLKSCIGQKVKDIVAGHLDEVHTEGIEKMFPVTLDSVHFKSGTLLLLAYGDSEPREMENVNGHAKFQNHYGRMHVQLSGNCKMWRSDVTSEDGGWLSLDVFVDNVEQQWHANLKVINLFAPLFERILEIPIMWSKGRASGEVHICMSKGEAFPNLHGQLNMTGLAFQIFDAPSGFSAHFKFQGDMISILLANMVIWGSGDILRLSRGRNILAEKLREVGVAPFGGLKDPLSREVLKKEKELDQRTYADVAKLRLGRLGDKVWLEVGRRVKPSRLEQLGRCLVGSWEKVENHPPELDYLKNWAVHAWLLKGKLDIAVMGGGLILFEFELVSEAERVLARGKRKVLGSVLLMERWHPEVGCFSNGAFASEVWVRVVGIPLHLWNREVFKLIGDGCGGFIAADNKTDSMAELQWARMLVKTVGRDTPSSVQIVDEMGCFLVQLWWESPPWFSQVVPAGSGLGKGAAVAVEVTGSGSRDECRGGVLVKVGQPKEQRGVAEPPCGSSSKGGSGFPYVLAEKGPGAEVIDGEDNFGMRSRGGGKSASLGVFKSGPTTCVFGPVWETQVRSGLGEDGLKPDHEGAQMVGPDCEPRPITLKGWVMGCEDRPFLIKDSIVGCEGRAGMGFEPELGGIRGNRASPLAEVGEMEIRATMEDSGPLLFFYSLWVRSGYGGGGVRGTVVIDEGIGYQAPLRAVLTDGSPWETGTEGGKNMDFRSKESEDLEEEEDQGSGWDDSSLAKFSKTLGFSTVGVEGEVLKLLLRLKSRRDQGKKKEI
ncbi:hypothetical protein CK203_005385 [Vitis vinifera]|uniref:DUF4283 domain-containing protein n=1 Tax=Vitis vinifera TaxID=29760 RepID=A0A438KEZ1_VITVI|nr:hypothetical protein CK203_005385 [Vitis vinifera]